MLFTSLFKHWSYRFFAPGVLLRQSYDAFKELLKQDGLCHDLMAEIELLYHEGRRLDVAGVNRLYREFSGAVAAMVENLGQLQPTDAAILAQYHKKIDFYIRFLLTPAEQLPVEPYILQLSDISSPELSGNKAYNLAILKKELHLPITGGFVITTNAFTRILKFNQLRDPVNALLAAVDIENMVQLEETSYKLTALISSATIPAEVKKDIEQAYDLLERQRGGAVLTAVRSSAASEDGEHSFAGQYHTELGVSRGGILEAYRAVLASKYTPEALFYRISLGLADEEAAMGVLVLPMVEAMTSGVIYTQNLEQPHQEEMVIHGIYGQGEVLVSGQTIGDQAYLDTEGNIIRRIKGKQTKKMILAQSGLKDMPLTQHEQGAFCLNTVQLAELGRWAKKIKNFYGTAQDIEWAINAEGQVFILQSRPLHQEKRHDDTPVKSTEEVGLEKIIVGGKKAAGGLAAGPVVVLNDTGEVSVDPGIVLVTRATPPSLARILNNVVAVIAEQGGTAGHFATVCREFGVPFLTGVTEATTLLKSGQMVTVDADRQTIYAGADKRLLGKAREKTDGELPYFKRLRSIMDFITPLNLLDPESEDFRADGCRSMHDIIRYSHELAVQTMFSLGERSGGKSSKSLESNIPVSVSLLDVGDGLCRGVADVEKVTIADICCQPFLALWSGLSHPGVDWNSHNHFDWKTFDEVALAGGVASKESGDLASYAIVSKDYLNLNMRFGYHFTLVDALSGADPGTSYCQLRFAGGGGDFTGRALRLEFLDNVLRKLGFEVNKKGDLLDARLAEIDAEDLYVVLRMLGCLLGATKLMDMVLKQEQDVQRFVEMFFNEQYTFTQTVH